MDSLKALIRDVPDFPKKGILFRDITPVLADPDAFEGVIDALASLANLMGVDKIIGIESRGFILGAPVAHALGLPFIPVRKAGKLPAATIGVEYALEYGTDKLEIHADALDPEDRVVIIDDLLATGGTAEAVCRLVEGQDAVVAGLLFMIELSGLGGVEKLAGRAVHSLLRY